MHPLFVRPNMGDYRARDAMEPWAAALLLDLTVATMRTCIQRCLILVITLGMLNGVTNPPAFAEEAEQVHQQLRHLKDALVDALNRRKPEDMLPYLHQDIVFTTMNADVVRGKDNIVAYFYKMMEGPDLRVKDVKVDFVPADLTLLYGDDTGIAYGDSKGHYVLADGFEFDVNARWTATLVKDQGKWVLAAFHYSTNMFDNPVLDALKSSVIKYGSAAIVLSLILGCALGYGLGRRKGKHV